MKKGHYYHEIIMTFPRKHRKKLLDNIDFYIFNPKIERVLCLTHEALQLTVRYGRYTKGV